jgi:hypothetical protein
VLVSSLVLAIGISILNISKKEFLIATSARDSSSALYAADSGIECAKYSESLGAFDLTSDKTASFGCNGVPHSAITRTVPDNANGRLGTFVFHARFGTNSTSCAIVTVTKTTVNSKTKTTIISRGYNIGWRPPASQGAPDIGPCDVASAKRVERGLSYASF